MDIIGEQGFTTASNLSLRMRSESIYMLLISLNKYYYSNLILYDLVIIIFTAFINAQIRVERKMVVKEDWCK